VDARRDGVGHRDDDDDDDDDDDGCPRSTTDRSVRWRGCSRMEFVEGGGEES